ncbi:MAG: hypothetical protein H7840_16275 [Alphaproteobacteria bacterium]
MSLQQFRTRTGRAVATVVCGSFLVSACQTAGLSDKPTFEVAYYKACYEPINYLRESERKMQETVVMGAIGGAVIGGLAGAFLGGDKNRGAGALVGAAGGALAGGAGAYLMQKRQQVTDDNTRFASYASDIQKDTAEMNRALAAAEQAQTCYKTEIANLTAKKKAGSIRLEEGRARLAEIVAGLREAKGLIEGAGKRFDDNIGTYQSAYEQELQEKGIDVAEVREAASWQPTPAAATVAEPKAKDGKKTPAKQPAAAKAKPAKADQPYVAASRELRTASQTNDRRRQVLLDSDQLVASACSQGGEFGGSACRAGG